MSEPVVVELWSVLQHPQVALIVAAPTGVEYTNQVAGVQCSHPRMEGFLVPLGALALSVAAFDPDHCGTGGGPLDEPALIEIEQGLRLAASRAHVDEFPLCGVSIRREEHNYEAWVHVRFRSQFLFRTPAEQAQRWQALWLPEDGCLHNGVLTWENSD